MTLPPNTAPDTTATLLQQVARGDRAAFAKLYNVAGPKLLAICVRMLSDRAEAEDALQDVMVKVWHNAASFDPDRGNGMSWLCAVTRNHTLDRLRARKPGRMVVARDEDGTDPLDLIADTSPSAEANVMARADMARVIACMGELPPDRARMVQGAYLQGLSYQDLAARADVPLNTMRTWLRRALLTLRECLSQ